MAELYTADEVMDFWDANATAEEKAKRAEISNIEKDMDTARKYVRDAIARYRKDKTRSRSRAKAEDPFVDLAEYTSRQDIQEAFGWGLISEKEMDRLWNLWDLREQSKSKKDLDDRVTMMLEAALNNIGSMFLDEVLDYKAKRIKMRHEAERVARENLMRG